MAARRKGLLLSGVVFSALVSCFLRGATCDIPDDVVYTDLHKTVRIGDSVVLTCQFRGTPLAVYWKKGDDPKTAPNLVSWIPTDDVIGLCEGVRPCQIMEMNGNYSLVIKEVSIAEQGRYICRVSSYRGILIHNFTDIMIFSTPKEPYPIINQCANDSTQVCSISTNESINITCSATNFYPDLDLFFLHGSQKMTDIASIELTNHDGTKNKAISIKASASKTSYICVASDIPGSKDQRGATIFVNSPMISTTRANGGLPAPSSTNAVTMEITPGTMELTSGNRTKKIVVPIIIILVIGAVIVCVCLWWKNPDLFRRIITVDGVTGSNSATTGDPEERIQMDEKAKIAGSHSAMTSDVEERMPMLETATITGDLSYYELWSLAYDTPSDEMKKIHRVLLNLGIKEVKVGLPAPDIYKNLCQWKDGIRKEKRVQLLQSALKRATLERRWIALCEQRQRTDVKVSQVTLDQIILDIQSPPKLQKFLHKLIPEQADNTDAHEAGNDPIVEATKLLRRWRNGPFTENPNALLSLALERSGCFQVDRTFFAGMVSFCELWVLTRMLTGNENEARDTLERLGMDLGDRLTEEDMYFLLCGWKEANTTSNQGKLLRDALERANSKEVWKQTRELREKRNTHISDQTLEHILWHIQDPEKIGTFLQKLTLYDSETCLDVSRGMKEIIKGAMGHLVKWKQRRFDENPIILLSHALDNMACSPLDRSFFKVPFELMANIIESEVKGFVDSLTRRHIQTMAPFLNIDKNEDTINAINGANKDTIFNTEAMLTKWIGEVECSNYEKRWRLKEAIGRIGRPDLTGYFQKVIPEIHVGLNKGTHLAAHPKGSKGNFHLSDFMEDEFQRIATYLSAPQLRKLFGDSDDPLNTIRAFVEEWLAKNPKQDYREKLRRMLKSAGFKGLVPYTSGSNLYLCELLDVAYRLLLEDVYPLAEALGISGGMLKQYKVEYVPECLNGGTTAALMEFSKNHNNDRMEVCEALSKAGYKDIAHLLEYGHETSFADEFTVASRARVDEDALLKISRNLGMSHTSNTETVLRDWKTMVRPPSYNHRTCLADAVFPVLGAEVADAILSGQYRGDGSGSSAVIHTISTAIESFELSLVHFILGVKGSKNLQDEQGITQSQRGCPLDAGDERQPTYMTEEQLTDGFTDSTSASFKRDHGESGKTETVISGDYKSVIVVMITQILGVTGAKNVSAQDNSIKQVVETWEEKIRKKPLNKDERRELSDKLLRAGFKQFAFEIMTGFIPSPRDKSKKKKMQDKNEKPGNQDSQDGNDDREKHERRDKPKKEKNHDKKDINNGKQNNQEKPDDNEKHDGCGKPSEHGKSTEPANQTKTKLEDKNDSEVTAAGENLKHDKEVQVEGEK